MSDIEPSPEFEGDLPAASTSKGNVDRKELAATAFERTRMPIVMTDARQPDYPIVLANSAFLKLTGYEAEEILGRNCRFLQGPGTSAEAIAQIRADLRQERESNVEILNYRKDGSPFWNKLHTSPIYDDEGRLIYYFASQIDVTKMRKIQSLEASEHRLLMEVDHRAKNVLAVVNSIVRLSDASDPHQYAASVQRRVQSLAVAHGMLAEQGWQDVSLKAIITGQTARYSGDLVDVGGPDVLMPVIEVQPLALVFHELVANAAVHGALRQASGAVSVTWDGSAETGMHVRWKETGGSSDTHAKRGFGNTMIDAMIEKQLGGSIERNWTSDGLEVIITLPAHKLEEAAE